MLEPNAKAARPTLDHTGAARHKLSQQHPGGVLCWFA
jgi:hypothetical protein